MFLSSKLVQCILVVVYGLFVFMGLSVLIYGIYLAATRTQGVDDDGMGVSGVSAIVLGSLDIIIGVFGLVGVLYKQRILIFIIIGFFACVVVTSIVILVVTIMATDSVSASAEEKIRNRIIKQYGNDSDHSSKKFTQDVNDLQKKVECCGFAGNVSENLFLKSPWYVLNNPKKTEKPRTLPISCCVESSTECQTSENLMAARDKKLAYKDDCLIALVKAARIFMWLTVVDRLITIVLLLACIGLNVMNLLEPVNE